uniref:Uncharacterized protein n=1 Tax=Anopheles albimanus TaxID=7167 RepID=A0A182F5M9_ANOAL
MVHPRSPQSSAFNSKLNQKPTKPMSSFLSKARAPLRELRANVEEPYRKPNDGGAALKGTNSPKKPLRVIDKSQSKKVAPRNDSNQRSKRSQNVTSGAAGHRMDRQRAAARTKASDLRHFKVYVDANEEQATSMRSSKSTTKDEALGKVRRALLNQEQAATSGQNTVSGRGKLESIQPMNELVCSVKANPLPARNFNVKPIEKLPNGENGIVKEPVSPASLPVVPPNSPVTPGPPITSTPAAASAVTVTPAATYVPLRGPSASPPSPSQTDFITNLEEGSGIGARWVAKTMSNDFPGTPCLRPFSGDSQRSSVEPTKSYDDLAPALATCSIAPKPGEMRPVLGRKIMGRDPLPPPLTGPTVPMPMPTFYPTRITTTKFPAFEHLTEYFPDRAEEIQRFYRQKELRRRKAIESMMIQNTRQTQQDSATAVSSADPYREPKERKGFSGQLVDKHCASENKYGAIGQTKNGYAPGVCARQLGSMQAVKQTISYETEELLRMNFLVCGNLWYDGADGLAAENTLQYF